MGYQEKISDLLTEDVIFILNRIENAGYEARIVGGAVRNLLMGINISDVDIATTALPNEIKMIFGESGTKIVPSGINYGTVTIIYHDIPYEITTLRRDIKNLGRKAIVEFTKSFEVDSERRDFTMNAIYMNKNGHMYDFHGGIDDIYMKKVRFIGNPSTRISEDFLRILRYFRFVSYYGNFECDAEYLSIIYSVKEKIHLLSYERIQNELLKIFELSDAYRIIPAMRPVLDELFALNQNPLEIAVELGIDLSSIEKFCLLLKFSSLFPSLNAKELNNRYKFPKRMKRLLALHFDINTRRYENTAKIYLKKIREEDRLFFVNWLAVKLCIENKVSKKQILKIREKLFNFCNSEYVDFYFRASDLVNYNLSKEKIKEVMKYTKSIWISSEKDLSVKNCKKIAENFIEADK